MTEPSKPTTGAGDPMTEQEQIALEKFEKWVIEHLDVEWDEECGAYASGAARNLFEAWQARAREEAALRECLGEIAKGLPHAPHTRSVKGGGNEHDPRWCNKCRAARLLGREAADAASGRNVVTGKESSYD